MANNSEDKSSLDVLLSKMPEIAEAVSKFPETVQQKAFDALMAEATGRPAPAPQGDESRTRTRKTTTSSKPKADGTKPPRRSGGPKQLMDLDLTPHGKPSFTDFVGEKQPKTNHDRNVLSVYYCARILEAGPVTSDHVYTCYRDMGWRLPSPDLNNGLSLTASRKRFFDTSDYDNIVLTSKGLNYVEHDLPPTKKEK